MKKSMLTSLSAFCLVSTRECRERLNKNLRQPKKLTMNYERSGQKKEKEYIFTGEINAVVFNLKQTFLIAGFHTVKD